MKKIFAFMFSLVLFGGASGALASEWMSVAVQDGALRQNPMPFGLIIAHLRYGDRVNVLERLDPWLKVRDQRVGREGWMHSASLISKKVKLKAGEKIAADASPDEIALGGKGFNRQVEAEYKKRDSSLSYAWVDRMERIDMSALALERFMAQGQLQPMLEEVRHEE
jgi:hypothetical protein